MRSAPALLALALFPLEREIANRSAGGITMRLNAQTLFPLLDGLFLLFLVVLGLTLVQALARTAFPLREVLGLPRRSSAPSEWSLGAALGWAVPLVSVLLLVLTRSVQFSFWTGWTPALLAVSTLLGIGAATLAIEITFRGLPFRWLTQTLGPTSASLLVSALFALIVVPTARHTVSAFVVAILLGLLLSLGWRRTHALWLSWGLNFAWTASLGALFGLPIAGSTGLSSIVQGDLESASAALGGPLGPENAPVTVLWLLLAFAILFRVTRDYAWNYTHSPIVPAGYAVHVTPPAAHATMEASAPPPPLVQILPHTPDAVSFPPRIPGE